MPITLIRLDPDTIVNIDHIVQVVVVNTTIQRQKRNHHYQTPEQIARNDGKYWKVYVYIRSDADYNAQAFTVDFKTQLEAQKWVTDKFGGSITDAI